MPRASSLRSEMPAKKKNGETKAASTTEVDLAQVERVIEFMAKHGLEEFEYHHGDLSIRLRRPLGSSNSAGTRFAPPEIVVAQPPAPAAAVGGGMPAAESGAAAATPAAEAAVSEELHMVKSPIVGTFYASPAPDAEPFVQVGDHVEPGQVLCIIEAMKLMNEIESDVAGEIIRIHVENGQPVEYGEPLFSIRPTRKK